MFLRNLIFNYIDIGLKFYLSSIKHS